MDKVFRIKPLVWVKTSPEGAGYEQWECRVLSLIDAKVFTNGAKVYLTKYDPRNGDNMWEVESVEEGKRLAEAAYRATLTQALEPEGEG